MQDGKLLLSDAQGRLHTLDALTGRHLSTGAPHRGSMDAETQRHAPPPVVICRSPRYREVRLRGDARQHALPIPLAADAELTGRQCQHSVTAGRGRGGVGGAEGTTHPPESAVPARKAAGASASVGGSASTTTATIRFTTGTKDLACGGVALIRRRMRSAGSVPVIAGRPETVVAGPAVHISSSAEATERRPCFRAA
ncbi:hypothetical protein [Streptomyces sp. CA-132043]|uniref:hypothetical protein n=1 Tax=Streptomyces sp. CA-132043 TaxID=3240048 RepID=UPI003D8A3DAF